jgi:uncharacterized membrane protein
MGVNGSPARVSWLLEEIPKWIDKGVIDAASAHKIRAYYGEDDGAFEGGRSYFLTLLAVLGSLLVSAGVILLFAYNWDDLSRGVKIAISFVPFVCALLLGSYSILFSDDRRVKEGAALFASASIAVVTALVSQIYHIDGAFSDFTMLILASALPLVYILDSHALAAAYSFGLFGLLSHPQPQHAIQLAYLTAIVPFLTWKIFSGGVPAVWSRYVAMAPLAFFVFVSAGERGWTMAFIAASSMLFCAGLMCREKGLKLSENPWLTAGWTVFTVAALAASGSKRFLDMAGSGTSFDFLSYLWIIPLAASFAIAFTHRSAVKIGSLFLPVLALVAFFAPFKDMPLLPAANIAFALFGALCMASGVRKRDLLAVNAGLIQLLLLFVFRFFDGNFGILTRSLTFIGAGALLIALNIWLSRRFKDAKADGREDFDEEQ